MNRAPHWLHADWVAMLLCLTTAACGGPVVSPDLRTGLDAYQRGDYGSALGEIRPLAEKGDARAENALGTMYVFGHGVPKDYTEAVHWFTLAVVKGEPGAQKNLGLMYADGLGVPKSDPEALRLFLLAARQGVASAQYNVGIMYVAGRGINQDYAEAFRWFSLGAAQGEVGSEYYVGSMQINGDGTPRDHVSAYMWLNLAAAQGHERAKLELVFLRAKMTPEQIADGERLARNWKRLSPGSATPASNAARADGTQSEFSVALTQLQSIRQQLIRKKNAHNALSSALSESTPDIFRRQIRVERDIIDELIKSNGAIAAIVSVADRLASGERLNTNYREVAEQLTSYDEGLKALQSNLTEFRESRQFFKRRLSQFIDDWTAAEPARKNDLVTVKAELEPETLDSILESQRSTIALIVRSLAHSQ
jgi:TPR repeat protein